MKSWLEMESGLEKRLLVPNATPKWFSRNQAAIKYAKDYSTESTYAHGNQSLGRSPEYLRRVVRDGASTVPIIQFGQNLLFSKIFQKCLKI